MFDKKLIMNNKQIKISVKQGEDELQFTVSEDIGLDSLYMKFDIIALFLTFSQSQIDCNYMERADEIRKEILD